MTTLSGGDGNDTFNLNGGTVDTVSGNGGADQFILGGATVTGTINGGGGNDTLTGTSGDDTFTVTGSDAGTVNTSIGFSAIETLEGADGNDLFAFNNGGTLSGTVRGGNTATDTGTNDRLSYANYTTDPNVDLAALGAIGIEAIEGSTQAGVTSTLNGANTANTWTIDGTNSGTVNGINFSAFTHLVGGNAADVFTLSAGGSMTTLSGGDGNDTFNLNGGTVATMNGNGGADQFNLASGVVSGAVNGNAGADVFRLNGATVSAINGGSGATDTDNDTIQGTTGSDRIEVTGTEAGVINTTITFSDIENFVSNGGDTTLIGTTGDDTLALESFSSAATIQGLSLDLISNYDGNSGTDTILGSNGNDTFQVSGLGAGQVSVISGTSSALRFQNVESLQGAAGNDTFEFADGVTSNAISIDGGNGTDDTVDFSSNTGVLTVDLTQVGNNIETVIGGSAPSAINTLLGFAANTTWTVSGDGSGTVTSGGTTLTFSNFSTLNGGSFVDTFNLNSGGIVAILNGGEGNDLFNFNGGTATTANGGDGSDRFTIAGTVSTNLNGGAGNDSFVLNSGSTITGAIAGGADTDTLDYSAYGAAVQVNLGAGPSATGVASLSGLESYIGDASQTNTITGLNSANTWNITGVNSGTVNNVNFTSFQNLVGGNDTDTITWDSAGSIVNGSINGGAGVLALRSDNGINFTGATPGEDIQGSGAIVIQPVTAGTNIQFNNAGTGLNIPASLLNELSNTFTELTIGSSETGQVALGPSTLTLGLPTTIQGAAIAATGSSISASGQNITLNAFGSGGITIQDINTSATGTNQSGGSIRLRADIGDIVVGALDTSSVQSLGGSINVTAPQGAVTLNGNINTGGAEGGGQIVVEARNDVTATGISIGATTTQSSGVASQVNSLQSQINSLINLRGFYQFFCSFFGFGCSTITFIDSTINNLQAQITALQTGTLIPGSIDIASLSGAIELTNTSLLTSSTGIGDIDGGSISLRANQDIILNNADISSDTSSTLGDGGSILLQAGNILSITNDSTIQASTQTAVASPASNQRRGGNITLSSTGATQIQNSLVSASTLSSQPAIAGDISLSVGELSLDNGQIIAETSNNSESGIGFRTVNGTVGVRVLGGNITIQGSGASVMTMANDSLISARAIQTGAPQPGLLTNSNPNVSGGNIFISGFGTVQSLTSGVAGNDIVTNAGSTNIGGAIDIAPSVLLGFSINTAGNAYDVLRGNGTNDIASNGTVAVFDITLGNESSLPSLQFLNLADLVDASCAPTTATSSFTVDRQGVAPLDPGGLLLPSTHPGDWIFIEDSNLNDLGSSSFDSPDYAQTSFPQAVGCLSNWFL
jgi:acrosin